MSCDNCWDPDEDDMLAMERDEYEAKIAALRAVLKPLLEKPLVSITCMDEIEFTTKGYGLCLHCGVDVEPTYRSIPSFPGVPHAPSCPVLHRAELLGEGT